MKKQKTLRKAGMELRKILAQNIRAYRLAKKLSQEDLADCVVSIAPTSARSSGLSETSRSAV